MNYAVVNEAKAALARVGMQSTIVMLHPTAQPGECISTTVRGPVTAFGLQVVIHGKRQIFTKFD